MLILIILLLVAGILIGVCNGFMNRHAEIRQLLTDIDPHVFQQYEATEQLLREAENAGIAPQNQDLHARLTDLLRRVKSREITANQRIALHNRLMQLTNPVLEQLAQQTANKQTPTDLLHSLQACRDHAENLQSAYQTYNNAANEYNQMIAKFPSNLIAFLLNLRGFKPFETTE